MSCARWNDNYYELWLILVHLMTTFQLIYETFFVLLERIFPMARVRTHKLHLETLKK